MAILALALLPTVLAVGAARADDAPYPAGESSPEIEGLSTTLVCPSEMSADKRCSLLLVMHGSGGTGSGMAHAFAGWAQDGYVVVAPQAHTNDWQPSELDAAKRIALHLEKVLPIDPKRLHVVGFSNGGWHLTPLAFDDDLHPASATWIAAGFQGGQVPKWAATDQGVIALAGSEDPNLRAAQATVGMLRGKVRSVEVRVQNGLGHAFPDQLVDYLHWWMNVMDGRFTAGDDRSFDWTDDLAAAVRSEAGAKKGGVMLWLWSADAADEGALRTLQHDVFFDPEVRFLGRQIPCVRLEAGANADTLARLGVKATPAVVVLDRDGKPKKVLSGTIKARLLASALKHVAPERRMPEDPKR